MYVPAVDGVVVVDVDLFLRPLFLRPLLFFLDLGIVVLSGFGCGVKTSDLEERNKWKTKRKLRYGGIAEMWKEETTSTPRGGVVTPYHHTLVVRMRQWS